MTATRHLAAIMFTDIVEYTALMGKDSAKALELVRISKEIQKFSVEKSNSPGIPADIKKQDLSTLFYYQRNWERYWFGIEFGL